MEESLFLMTEKREALSAKSLAFDAKLYGKSLMYLRVADQDYSLEELHLRHMSQENFDYLR